MSRPSIHIGPGMAVGTPVSGVDAAHTIIDIRDSGGFCYITTATEHGLTSETIVVSGNSVAGYNTTHAIQDAPGGSTLLTDIPYTSDGTGGAWVLA